MTAREAPTQVAGDRFESWNESSCKHGQTLRDCERCGAIERRASNPYLLPAAAEEAWWTGCRQQITTGGALLSAQRTAAMHWAQHVAAQTSFDAKKITAAQAKAQWAASKAFGPADMAASAAAETAYRAAASACGTPARAVDPARMAAAHACSTFATKQAGAIGHGRAVVAQWAAHLDMMGHKADMTGRQYMAKWTAMVRAAAVPLAAFFAAAKAVGTAPSCAATTR